MKYHGYEAMRRSNNLHTEMIIARDSRMAMNVFWVLGFARIEIRIEENEWRAHTSANIGRQERLEPN
jgi:hypothetical protein